MKGSKIKASLLTCALAIAIEIVSVAKVSAREPREATAQTKEVNAAIEKILPFNNKEDFQDAERGLIAQEPSVVIRNAQGVVVWDLSQYSFLTGGIEAPDTVNPSLWRQARLNLIHGLFKVADHIYQVRGYDISNISFVEGKTGYIVIDPLISAESAKAALELLYKHAGKKPVVAVIYTHSHLDHWGGVKGLVSERDVKCGKVKIIASSGFLEEALSENVLLGNAMRRRALYMYGNLLPKNAKGQVDAGIGKITSQGSISLIAPTDIITKTGQSMVIDGVKIIFQYTPDTEASTEINLYFPQFKALCMAENCTHTLHNLSTLRGAEMRDAKAWSYFLNEAIELFGDKSDVVFAGHHWPRWGKDKVIDLLKKQRDLYKYIHDQTLRLANHGYGVLEITEMIELPDELALEWYNRGYYGTLSHNIRAVYQRYLGWFDGNPVNLNPLPPVEAGKQYVEFMGGSAAVLRKAKASYSQGQYRWVAEVLSHLVSAEPDNRQARDLQADALEQLGFQAESGPWRNFYLTAARELREGNQKLNSPLKTININVFKAMPVDIILDYMSVRLNGPKASGRSIKINLNFPDTKQLYAITLENSALTYVRGKQLKDADSTLILKRETLNDIIARNTTFKDRVTSGDIVIDGDKNKFSELLSLLDNFDAGFKIAE